MINQRRKGHSFERSVAGMFKELYPDSKRHLEYQFEESNGVDVYAGPFAIQCKNTKQYAPVTKILEIKDDKKIHLLVTKGKYKKPVVVMYLDDFLNILRGSV